ncbi:MAG TPA: CZB domain-containing protein [Bacteroidota bacterium]|nr:CZB domain-containing protein [Bacteroidota bacterium]
MVTKEPIEAALTSHGEWKKRLSNAIGTGISDFDPEALRRDKECDFGKWLHALHPSDTVSENYRKVKSLHASLHTVAAETLQLAVIGKREEARKRLAPGGIYARTYNAFDAALHEWMTKL